MRRLLWVIFLFSAYIWVVTSGQEELFLNRGKAIYKAIAAWLEDADIDYHLKADKKKSRPRWK